jgi:hypothetical protein
LGIKLSRPAPDVREHLRTTETIQLTTTGIPKRSARFRRRSCSSASTSSTSPAPRFFPPGEGIGGVAPVCADWPIPKRSARALSLAGSYATCYQTTGGETEDSQLQPWPYPRLWVRVWMQVRAQGQTWSLASEIRQVQCRNALHVPCAFPAPRRPQ